MFSNQIQNKREVKSFIGEDLESLSEDKTEKKKIILGNLYLDSSYLLLT